MFAYHIVEKFGNLIFLVFDEKKFGKIMDQLEGYELQVLSWMV